MLLIEMLLNDQLAFAQSSRSIKDTEYQQAEQKGFTLKQIPVAIDGIAIAVNPELNIPGLTVAQVQEIYTGQITNWDQLGRPYLPIIAYSRRPEDSGTIEFFVENILNGSESQLPQLIEERSILMIINDRPIRDILHPDL